MAFLTFLANPVDAFAAKEGKIIEAANNRYELSKCEELLREEINKKLMLEGVSIIDPKSTYIDRDVNFLSGGQQLR